MLSYVLCGHIAERTFSGSTSLSFKKVIVRDFFFVCESTETVISVSSHEIFSTNKERAPLR